MFVDIYSIKNKYKLLYIDPPWQYNNKNTGGGMNSGSANKYEVMSLEEIKKLPIRQISNEDSIIFLWTTTNFIHEALHLLEDWGYEYKTAIYWDKERFGMGFWFRGQIEICLFGVKGNIKPFKSSIRNIIRERSIVHSKKPEKMYEIIESFSINPKVELFARERRHGWDYWGHGVENEI